MRKYVLIVLLVILTLITICVMAFGIHIGNLNVYSYSEIKTVSNEKNAMIASLKNKNSVEFEAKKQALQKAVETYNNRKSQYEKMVAAGQISDNAQYKSMDLYDIDYLWTIIGNYATQQGITLQFDVTKSASANSISSEYEMCDLSFTVTGDYIAITDFLYSIENDDKLNFEINDFVIEKGGQNLQATFIVVAIPINSANLKSVPSNVISNVSEN